MILILISDRGEFFVRKDHHLFSVSQLDVPFLMEVLPLKVFRRSQLLEFSPSGTVSVSESNDSLRLTFETKTGQDRITIDSNFWNQHDCVCLSGIYPDHWLGLNAAFEVFAGNKISFCLFLQSSDTKGSKRVILRQVGQAAAQSGCLLQRDIITNVELSLVRSGDESIILQLECDEPEIATEKDPRQLGCVLSSVLIDGIPANQSSIAGLSAVQDQETAEPNWSSISEIETSAPSSVS